MDNTLLAYQQDFIELALDCHVLQFGEFELKSGRISLIFSMRANSPQGWPWRVWGDAMPPHCMTRIRPSTCYSGRRTKAFR